MFKLHPQSPNINVDRPVPRPHLPPPREPEQVFARGDAIRPPGELGKQAQLTDRQHERMPPDPRDVLIGKDLKRPYLERFARQGCGRKGTRADRQRAAIVPRGAQKRVTSP